MNNRARLDEIQHHFYPSLFGELFLQMLFETTNVLVFLFTILTFASAELAKINGPRVRLKILPLRTTFLDNQKKIRVCFSSPKNVL